MQTRELPRREWSRLKGTELGPYALDNPDCVLSALVVEDHGAIVGTWGLVTLLHAEGVWIREDHRGKAAVARRLLSGMRRKIREFNVRGVLTAASTPEIAALLEQNLHAERVPVTPYFWPVRG